MTVHNIVPGKKFPNEIYVVLEIPKGSRNKYEFNEEFEWIGISHLERFPAELRRSLSRTEAIPKFLEEKHTFFLSEDWAAESRFSKEEKNLYGVRGGTILAVPLFRTQDVHLLPSGHWLTSCPILGFLFCSNPEKVSAFDRQLIHLMNTIANLSATAIENSAHLQEETARQEYAMRRQSPVL